MASVSGTDACSLAPWAIVFTGVLEHLKVPSASGKSAGALIPKTARS
jgi:hypothetical protein